MSSTNQVAVLAALAGSAVTFLAQTTANRNSSRISLRVGKTEAYVDFVAGATNSMGIVESILDFERKSRALRENIAERRDQYSRALAAASNELADGLSATVSSPMSIEEEIPLLAEQIERLMERVHSHIKNPANDELIAKIKAKLHKQVDEIERLAVDLALATKNLPRLREAILENGKDMNRALGRMQLAAPHNVLELGQSLYFGFHNRLDETITKEEVESRYHQFVTAARYDLSHPLRARIVAYLHHPHLKKRPLIIRPNA